MSIVSATLLFPAGARAQPDQPSGPDGLAPPAEIIVTGRRREELLEDTPVPLSVARGDELARAGVRQADELNQLFPALTVLGTATGNLVFIRGVGNFTLLANSDPAIGFSYDGVFITRPNATMSPFFDLERVELLKGPQGVLYGRNASGGSINIEPRQPVFGELGALVAGSAATSDDFKAEAALNLPVGPAAAVRLAGSLGSQEHFLDGYSTGPRHQAARAQVKLKLGRDVTVRVSADHTHLGGVSFGSSYIGNYVYVPAEGRYAFNEAPTSLSEGLYSADAQAYRQSIFLPGAGRNLDAIGSRPRQDNRFTGLHARFDADLGFGQLTVIPAWRRSVIDAVMASSPFGFEQDEKSRQTSLEARLTGRTGRLSWLTGAFLMNERLNVGGITNLSTSLNYSDEQYRTRSRALFGTLTVDITSALRLSGGLRWTHDRKEYERESETFALLCQQVVAGRRSCPTVPLFALVDSPAELPFAVPATPGSGLPILVGGVPTGAVATRSLVVTDGRLADKAMTWRLGTELDLAPRTLLYGAVERGYRPGGFNPATGFETYDPERILAFTLGLRHRSDDRRLEFDLEAFWWKYRDQQVSAPRPDLSTPPRVVTITDNVGNSRISGLEAQARYRLWRGALVGGTVQYLHARYGSFRYLQGNSGAPPLTGCDAILDVATNLYTVDCTSKQPYNSPRWSLSLQAQQEVRLGRFRLTAFADRHYRSARTVGSAFLPEQRVGPTWTSNVQLVLSQEGQDWELGAFIRNLEGERTPQFVIFHPVSNALVAVPGSPRQFGLRASRRF
ncbi:TonB-dependent receptor [Sphingomonas arenae]|uniref:TonB-dependent receptor n=1 Tax=Sphingomonas arenae TaxID=2812555 RepID=UPI0019679C13|nr:TonB-dependent receptor [Sphingomonas arenae]